MASKRPLRERNKNCYMRDIKFTKKNTNDDLISCAHTVLSWPVRSSRSVSRTPHKRKSKVPKKFELNTKHCTPIDYFLKKLTNYQQGSAKRKMKKMATTKNITTNPK